jgi:hypothetical protein
MSSPENPARFTPLQPSGSVWLTYVSQFLHTSSISWRDLSPAERTPVHATFCSLASNCTGLRYPSDECRRQVL